jgi:hypothetical protein
MDQTKNGFVIAEGILQEGNEINRNRRFYPTEELAAALMSPRTQELVKSGNFKGEAGHPTDTSIARQAKVDPTLEQVWYQKLWMDGDYVMGQFRGTNNDLGRSFNDDLRDGQKPSFSLRAVGSLVNENGRATVKRMQMITYDRVYFPSHSKAYTTKIVTTEAAVGKPSHEQQIYDILKDDYFFVKSDEINRLAEAGNFVDLQESIITPLKKEEVKNYLLSESANLKLALDTFDLLFESMEVANDIGTMKIKTTYGDTIYLDTETALKKEMLSEINNYF